ncbi:MAG: hypothetical protein FJY20_06470 [Bacteroidetes bacterium]|nr:hypothetical protein [Bacteroidota bacterium]
MKKYLSFFVLIVFSHCCGAQSGFKSGNMKLAINKKGFLTQLSSTETGINYLATDTIAPLLTVISNTVKHLPSSTKYNTSSKILAIKFEKTDITIQVAIKEKKSHVTFEIVKAEPSKLIDGILWGPVPLSISETIGEIIGVVRNKDVAVGIQVLNIETDGGDYTPEGATFDRGKAALKTAWGSTLQAHSINRDRQRFINSWTGSLTNTPVAPMKGKTVVGSKIAIFSCREPETLNQIEKIELAEELPHPMINGKWVKHAWQRGHSYLISEFTEKNIDNMIAYTKRAGLVSLYHSEPFSTWGNFELNPAMFPNGRKGLKNCADKARNSGLFLGLHVLTNFITSNDRLITPVPDRHLALTGYGLLTQAITATSTEIPVSTPEYFNDTLRNDMHTVMIGAELIRYKSVSASAPFKLLDCQRGAFGTKAAAHAEKDTVGKLYDHPYKIFFPDIVLQDKVVKNIADLFKETGVNHLDFDGFEGCLASGQGDYAVNKFAYDFYNQVQHPFLNGTSISKSFYWHINTYCNWGEPWYGGFRESMQTYRIDNQKLFDRNLMPHMLGWYLLTPRTTIAEMEWMLARAAGFDAGFAMVSGQEAIELNPDGLALLDLIREWETARLGNAFSSVQRELMQNTANEFHLEKINKGQWKLYQMNSSEKFIHKAGQKQPGEPTGNLWTFTQKGGKQPLRFVLTVQGEEGAVSKTRLLIDDYFEITIPDEIKAGQTLTCEGNKALSLYDDKGKFIKYIEIPSLPELDTGAHKIFFDTRFSGNEATEVRFEVKSFGLPEKIIAK